MTQDRFSTRSPTIVDTNEKRSVRTIDSFCIEGHWHVAKLGIMARKLSAQHPRTPEGYVQPADPRRILLCVSLTPPFHDLHYEVIATVFELPA